MSEQKQSAAEAVQQIRAALVKAYNRAERNGDAQMGVYVMSAIAVLPVLEEAVRDGARQQEGR